MSSGSSAFKVAAVVAVLAMLVLPSLGRCPSLGPAASPASVPMTPPTYAPVPAPSPGPAPPVSCSDCRAPLIPACINSKCAGVCSSQCDPPPGCDECRAKARNCTACCNDGTCDCACKTNTDYDCRGGCYVSVTGCQYCQMGSLSQCMADCLSDCNDTCAKE